MTTDTPVPTPSFARRMQMCMASMAPDHVSAYFMTQATIANHITREVFQRRLNGEFCNADRLLAAMNPAVRHMAQSALQRYFPEVKRPEHPLDSDDFVPPSPRAEDDQVRVVPETPVRDLDQFHELRQGPAYGPPSPDFGPQEAKRDMVLLDLNEEKQQPPLPPVVATPPPRSSPRFAGPVTRSKIKSRVGRRAAGPRTSRPARRRL